MKKIRKKIKTRVIPYALANNAYASIILPKLKRFKYDHDKIIKPKPNIYINIKSDEIIDGYYNLPNPIELNGSYQAALYKIDIENKIPINNYELTLTTINLENDNYLFEAIKDEQKEYLSNIKEYKPEYIENNFNKKNEDLQTLLNKEIENLNKINNENKNDIEIKIINDKKYITSVSTDKDTLNKDIGDLDKKLFQEKSKLDLELKTKTDKLNNVFKEDINKLKIKKLEDEKAVVKKIKNKQITLNELIGRIESKFYSNLVKNYINPIKKVFSLNDPGMTLKKKSTKNKYEKNIYKFNEISPLIEFLKNKFQTSKKSDTISEEYNFSPINHNYIVNVEENHQIPYLNLKLTKLKSIDNDKLTIKIFNPKLSLIQPIYCDFIYYNVSNNNVISYINIKNKYLSESINEIENITYFKVTQTNINRIKIYFSEELKKVLDFLNIKYFITLHLKPL